MKSGILLKAAMGAALSTAAWDAPESRTAACDYSTLSRDSTFSENCQDGDADGYGVGCRLGPDGDDGDPRVNSGWAELPDDGLDNDCLGDGDLTHSAALGVFVAPRGDDSFAGGASRLFWMLERDLPIFACPGSG